MRRREFITLLGGASAAWPRSARAQQQPMPVVGLLNVGSPESIASNKAAFLQGLKETGYVDGQNLVIEDHFADFRNERLPALAADLVRHRVSVIAAIGGGAASAIAAKTATATIPIVFANGGDPVGLGLVASLNRPGGNITGVYFLVNALGSKRLELLRELVPTAATIGFLVDPTNPNTASETTDMSAAAGALTRNLLVVKAGTEREIDAAFASLVQQRADALIVAAQSFFTSRRDQVLALTQRHALPAMYGNREFVTAGGLMSYGTSIPDAYRQAGVYTGRILKGEKPADLPVVSSRPGSSWRSISRPPRRLASTCRQRCSPSRMMSSINGAALLQCGSLVMARSCRPLSTPECLQLGARRSRGNSIRMAESNPLLYRHLEVDEQHDDK
jgi:putative tryptophan/tyrosine transport system substrate-binding protein